MWNHRIMLQKTYRLKTAVNKADDVLWIRFNSAKKNGELIC
ncbi:hypothetical protein CHISP_1680 [Chitinispirillum alkaliphilum]|nr:hypothetical protein CHISP_1680 [Chitinispirillum alkaliphilum]